MRRVFITKGPKEHPTWRDPIGNTHRIWPSCKRHGAGPTEKIAPTRARVGDLESFHFNLSTSLCHGHSRVCREHQHHSRRILIMIPCHLTTGTALCSKPCFKEVFSDPTRVQESLEIAQSMDECGWQRILLPSIRPVQFNLAEGIFASSYFGEDDEICCVIRSC